MIRKTMHLGLDDTDSTRMGCTTYVIAILVEKLSRLGVEFIDYPNLIRLNPNVPWKTRGNGALCLRIRCNANVEEKIKETTMSTVEEHADLEAIGTDPGIVFFEGEKIPREIKLFAKNAITDVVHLEDAIKLLGEVNAEATGFKSGRGIIGGLAAIGETLQEDHTYEILAYRVPENCGTKRRVDEASVFKMERNTAPYTFNNVDAGKKRVIITPRGPDPLLFGIRGETPDIVREALNMVKPLEPIERWVIFRTNQGTDAHLKQVERISQIRSYSPVIVRGTVSVHPKIVPRRHVIFTIKDGSGEVDCAAYEPTGNLTHCARELVVGDFVEVHGGVRALSEKRPLTINLEKINVLRLAPRIVFQNPVCPKCGRRLKSMGKTQGFRCERCRTKHSNAKKVEVREKRGIKQMLYITSIRSQRHLTKPLRRYGLEKRFVTAGELMEGWHSL